MGKPSPHRTRTKILAVAALSAIATFLPLLAIAMARYPGGTWCDRGAIGHQFWANYLCDLLHARALGGVGNPAAPFARAGMLALVVGVWALFLALPADFPNRPSLARWLRVVG